MTGPSPELLVLLALVTPFVGALAVAALGRWPNLREAATLVTGAALFAVVLTLSAAVFGGARPELAGLAVAPGLALAFEVEPLGMLFALVASGLWIVNSIYSIGYMRAHDEPRQTTFYVCFALAIGSTIGIAFAQNLFALFLFYEALTLSTFPLVTHKQSPEAMRSGRLYLLLLLGTSMVLFLPAIAITWALSGTLDFTAGGLLAGKASPLVIGALLGLYVFGIGKAAVMPVHFWLPAAMVAPTPVSAFLHAVAVVKAGVFSILKVVVYVFGPDALRIGSAGEWLVWVACASLLLGSLIALRQDNLKARLAYSTVSQLAYVVVGAALATPAALTGAGLQIATHAAAKITLFFCAGAIYVAAHKTQVSELDGIGRRMPITMTAFFVGSLSIIGLPPLGGLWSKWMLGVGAMQADAGWVLGVLMVSSLLSAAYLLPIPVRAFFAPSPEPPSEPVRIQEAPLPCLLALTVTAILSILLFFQAEPIAALLRGVPGAG